MRSGTRPEMHYYALSLSLPESTPRTSTVSLIVRTFAAQDPYNEERIVYRTSPYAVDFYNYHRWAASPAQQTTDWTVQYLRASGLFAKVLPIANTKADYVLHGIIRQFEEIDADNRWDATLTLDLWLTRDVERTPFWTQSYTSTQTAAKRAPEAVAAAMSHCLEDILQRLTADLATVIASNAP